jgi:glycine/D-amino acid oxidase-like deaminating enzyme
MARRNYLPLRYWRLGVRVQGQDAFRDVCEANDSRVAAAKASFLEMSSRYKKIDELAVTQACMRPCPPDALPYTGPVPDFEGAYITVAQGGTSVMRTDNRVD